MFKLIRFSILLFATMFFVACSPIESDAKSVVKAMFEDRFQEAKSLDRKFREKYKSDKDRITYEKAYAKWWNFYEKEKQQKR